MRLKALTGGAFAHAATLAVPAVLTAVPALVLVMALLGATHHAVGQSPPPIESPGPVPAGETGATPGDEADTAAAPPKIRFNLKGATLDQVIDFFSRASGLPVVKETDVPEGVVDYFAPEAYDLPEALRVLNIILQSRGVMLRIDDEMLYLQRLTEMQREDIPLFVGTLPEALSDEQIITVVRPLDIALAKPLAERLSEMIASYGSVAALEQQNSLVITETVGQVRRLLRIVDELDREDPEGAIEIFKIRNARAADLMQPLNSLLARRVEKYVVNEKGKQTKIQEDQMQGLNITFDERTNSIVAKGAQSRIDKLREAIQLLDVPASDAGRSMRTVVLSSISLAQAAQRLQLLYAQLPEEKRPTVLPLDDVAKITIVGDETAITEGLNVLREIDGNGIAEMDGERQMTVVSLEHADPAGLIEALKTLLNGRQLVSTRLVAGPDGRSIIVSGPSRDVDAVRSVVTVLDRPKQVDAQVRLLRLEGADAADTLARAQALWARETAGEVGLEIDAELDADSGLLTVIGSGAAQERFAAMLRMVQATVARETRQFELAHATPSQLVSPLATLARRVLQTEGAEVPGPQIDAVVPLDLLIVTAVPTQFPVHSSLIESLDRATPADYRFRVFPLQGVTDVGALQARAMSAFRQLSRGYEEGELSDPTIEFDEITANLLVSGDARAVQLFEQALAETRRLQPPARSGRMIALREARAADVVSTLEDLIQRSPPVDPARRVPPPTIEIVERTNSLYVVAEPAQHELLARFVRELDTFAPTQLPPMRLLQVRAADATQLASLLRDRYERRPSEQRRDLPVDVSSDAGTNTLIVVAHEQVFGEIKDFVDEVNRAGDTTADRETMIFPLRRARAIDLAQALEKLYPQPPMPLDRRGRPLPHLQEPKEIHVSADAATNTLIVEAPIERRASFDALVEQLDRVELPPTAELRTYAIERGDPQQIAQTLTALARQGVLSAPPIEGGKAVEVTIQYEPMSRTLIVAGDEVTFAKTESILTDLEAVPVPRSLRVFEVTGTDPQKIADQALRLYADQTAEVPGAGAVSVEVDRESASLLVVADDEAMIRVAGIINELQDAIGAPPELNLMALQYADAVEVVEFLDDLATSADTLLGGMSGPPPAFEAIERTNSVLIASQPEQRQLIASIVQSLDVVQDQEMPPLRILQLRTADASNLATALMRQYSQRPIEQRATRPVTITADPETNALVVAAHPEMLPEIQAIVRDLNDTSGLDMEGREIRIFPLQVARAEELARTIDEMFPQPPVPLDRRGRPMPHLRQPREVVVRADRQTNSLIVDAPSVRMAGFEELVQQLDRQEILTETEVRTYPVVHADLDGLAATLRELPRGGTLAPTGRDRRAEVTVATEPVSGTLIVSGPVEVFERVEQVLGELDVRRSAPATTLRFFKLEYARADAMATMLREILLARIIEDVPEAGSDIDALLNVTADRKTNTLIISAPSAIMPV
ncbi:MAG: secretin N-terminal domain-containing protein, partial [Planctomycetota bacterium]